MNLILVISSLSCGGAERVMSDMADYWSKKGWKITLVTLNDRDQSDYYLVNSAVTRIRVVPPKKSKGPWGKLKSVIWEIRELRSVIRGYSPSAVLSFIDTANIFSIIATFGMPVRVVVAERTDPRENLALAPVWRIARKLLYRRADLVIAQTKNVGSWIEEMLRARVCVIPNPLRPLPSPASRGQRERIVLSVGRLAREKGCDVLIRAFAEVSASFPEWQLFILGEGPERDRLTELCVQLDVKARVTLVGRVSNVEEWMGRAGLVVQASRFEGFPNVVLEAMGMGAPVISTDCRSGPREIITDRVNGRLTPVDDVDSLARAMTELMADPFERARLGEAAIQVRDKYAQQRVMLQWDAAILSAR